MMLLIDSDYLQSIKFHPLPYMQITPPDVAPESYKRGWNDVVDVVLNDADPVVRCKDCKAFITGQNESESWEWCEIWERDCDGDGYCSYSKRREGGDNNAMCVFVELCDQDKKMKGAGNEKNQSDHKETR